ncbi:MAG: complex I NDUFA9 subunit family protein [Gammaproteobacteria bacterium]
MKTQTLCILGGTGFVGRHLISEVTEAGWRVRVPTRRRARHRDLTVNPRVSLVEADVHDSAALAEQLCGCEAVVNLIGILNEAGHDGSGFRRAHVELAQKLVRAAREQGVTRVLHMSALNADAHSEHGYYLKTKGEAEELMHAAGSEGLQVTSFRPSVIFGAGDSFFNRFAALLRWSPGLLPLACAGARFAPVYVGDVTKAFARALRDKATIGERYELCGPHIYTLRELVEYTARTAGLKRRVLPLGDGLSHLQARVLEYAPGKPFSLDNYYSLQKDSVCGGSGLQDLGIEPTALEAVVPQYLGRQSPRARYSLARRLAGRDAGRS